MSTETSLETIQRLRQACEMAESLIAGNRLVSDENAHCEPFDFKIGDFGVVDLQKRDWERNSALENWFPFTAEAMKTLRCERDHYMKEMYRAVDEIRKLRRTL